jgi:hypothetical protein
VIGNEKHGQFWLAVPGYKEINIWNWQNSNLAQGEM